MTGPPTLRPDFETAPPIKRVNPDGIPVRLYDGALIAHVNQGLVDELLAAGDAEECRRGPRRYLRLRQGIHIPQTERGWDIIESLRMQLGDKEAATYVARFDRRAKRLRYQPPGRR
jgi:hypothetical protein